MCYIGERGKPFGLRLGEHTNSLKQGLMEKSRLAKHAYEEWHRIQWKETVQTEANNICKMYKEAAHMACIMNPISQPSLEISPIWIPLIREKVSRLQGNSLYKPGSSNQIFMLWISTSLIDLSSHLSLPLVPLFSCCFNSTLY
jgi:hypothetical protein